MIRILVVAIILISIISGGGFWYWTTSPLYSLEQIKESVRDHNLSKFQMYFSTDEVANSMVKDLIASPIRKALGGETLERFLNSGMVSPSTVQHEVASGIAGDIKMLVETGGFNEPSGSDLDKASMSTLDKRLGIKTITLTKIQDIKVDGNLAVVSMSLHNEKFNADLVLVGEMQNKDGYWQATRIVNVVDFFNKLFELERASSNANVKSETMSEDENENVSDAEATKTEK